MNYIDIHSHLNFDSFDEDREGIIQKLKDEGGMTITVGTDLQTSKDAINLAKKHEHLFATVGVHPTDVLEENFDAEQFLELAKHPKVLAIGECGLDYFRDQSEIVKTKQKEIFKQHIELAIAVNKPLMIHARPSKGTMDAYEDVLDILSDYQLKTDNCKLACNFHFFVGDKTIAERIIKNNWTMSFDGPITFTDEYDEVIKYIPIEYIMAETDSPFATGVPNRGKRGDPTMVTAIYQRIAELKEMDFDKCRIVLNENARRVFNLQN